MNEVPQLAGAMLAIAFAAVMLVAGELYIENASATLQAAALKATVPGINPLRTHLTKKLIPPGA
jgi:hypothetical protein